MGNLKFLAPVSFFLLAATIGGIFIFKSWQTTLYYSGEEINNEQENSSDFSVEKEKVFVENGQGVKGIYMNGFLANSQNQEAIATREEILSLLKETELNAVVIDIKESYGIYLPASLKEYIKELHENNVWVIARICAFRDSSLRETYPDWYLKYKNDNEEEVIWQDSGNGHWLDPKSRAVQDYVINFSKRAIDFDFDELQFDYVRFPSDGDVENIIYPFYDSSQEEKYQAIREFFSRASQSLKNYDPEIILSVDIFGYIAVHNNSTQIGQRTKDAAEYFDYISYMLYPSHFYDGLQVSRDEKRELPFMYLTNNSEDLSKVVSNNVYAVIARSIFAADDYIFSLGLKSKIRPWLQDFDINRDAERGIYYDNLKVKDQILASEESGADGWLLWNPSGIYNKEALIGN